MGKGIRLDANLAISEESIKGLFAVNNPNFRLSGNSLNTRIESSTTNRLADQGYKTTRTGFSFGTYFEQWEDIYLSPKISTYYEDLSTTTGATPALTKQDGTYFYTDLSYAIISDKRDQTFQTTEGYRATFFQSIPLIQDSSSVTKSSGCFETGSNPIARIQSKSLSIEDLSSSWSEPIITSVNFSLRK